MSEEILYIGNVNVELSAPIRQRIQMGKLTVVRIYPSDEALNEYPQEKFNRNIYAYDAFGELVWQIQVAPHGGRGEDKVYMDIKVVDDTLIAENWVGANYMVNMTNGLVLQFEKNIRPW